MYRFFSLQDDVFRMQSQFEDDFGLVVLNTWANLHVPEIHQQMIGSGSISMSQRIAEMNYFLPLLKLFDPECNKQTTSDVSEILPPPPSEPEPWET